MSRAERPGDAPGGAVEPTQACAAPVYTVCVWEGARGENPGLENILPIRLAVLASPEICLDIIRAVFMTKCVVPIEKIVIATHIPLSGAQTMSRKQEISRLRGNRAQNGDCRKIQVWAEISGF